MIPLLLALQMAFTAPSLEVSNPTEATLTLWQRTPAGSVWLAVIEPGASLCVRLRGHASPVPLFASSGNNVVAWALLADARIPGWSWRIGASAPEPAPRCATHIS